MESLQERYLLNQQTPIRESFYGSQQTLQQFGALLFPLCNSRWRFYGNKQGRPLQFRGSNSKSKVRISAKLRFGSDSAAFGKNATTFVCVHCAGMTKIPTVLSLQGFRFGIADFVVEKLTNLKKTCIIKEIRKDTNSLTSAAPAA